ncbi:transcriptional regulator with sigma factor-related N-terminal domain [Hoeflea sp. IMCC20628]|uniref:sugar-binding transcriptional regulator n=1 Tax=Hoeflea sp. IMCC20628 TaxID=1620421 RepID=UPI00063A9640|nr:sugar-binding transcriptional regulator [Hoeflea sp. IMCC20628]AKI00741.1 transcriptional regulator with sigma factor-related N-terminal domain [Hoeflea sp. IMCC20628]
MAQNPTRRSTKQISGEDIVVETAWLYYHDGLNQSDIATRLMVSRATVVNYLQEARERGYIHTKLSPEAFTTHRAALKLCERFDLKAAYILPDGTGGPDDHASRITRGAADWLPSLLEPGDRLGIAWGKTVYDVAEQLEQTTIPDLTVLQLVGSMATPYGFSADVCSSNMARKFSATCINLHVPAILSSAKIAATLRAETLIAQQFEAVSNCNKTLFAVGSCNPDSHIVSSGLATLDELDQYKAMGAVGVLCGRFINADGDPVSGPLDDRMMGVELEKLRDRDAGILVSISEDRAGPTVAALKGGYATHVVTDQRSANAMMNLA